MIVSAEVEDMGYERSCWVARVIFVERTGRELVVVAAGGAVFVAVVVVIAAAAAAAGCAAASRGWLVLWQIVEASRRDYLSPGWRCLVFQP